MLSLGVLSAINIRLFFSQPSILGAETSPVDQKLIDLQTRRDYWQNLLLENPQYFDGWLELAKIYSELGDTENSLAVLAKARQIDPNSAKFNNRE